MLWPDNNLEGGGVVPYSPDGLSGGERSHLVRSGDGMWVLMRIACGGDVARMVGWGSGGVGGGGIDNPMAVV